jgi:hypothetical protein
MVSRGQEASDKPGVHRPVSACSQVRAMPWMVKYQDTGAYKKATDEQLRLRDALEKEIRQREADKIQREAWRLDAIDRARAQPAVPVGVTETPRRRGARPKYPWEEMEAKTYQLMGYHGPFSADDPVWDAQARLEEKLLKFYYDKTGREPASAA